MLWIESVFDVDLSRSHHCGNLEMPTYQVKRWQVNCLFESFLVAVMLCHSFNVVFLRYINTEVKSYYVLYNVVQFTGRDRC